MENKTYFRTASIIFLLAGLLHLYRSVTRSQLVLGNFIIPEWFSWLLVIMAGIMCFYGFKLGSES